MLKQHLVHVLCRGWRRSGEWLYTPKHRKTCCQLLTLRLDVNKFRPSRTHRKTLRRWEAFLSGEYCPSNAVECQNDDQMNGASPKRSRSTDDEDGFISSFHEIESIDLLAVKRKKRASSLQTSAVADATGTEILLDNHLPFDCIGEASLAKQIELDTVEEPSTAGKTADKLEIAHFEQENIDQRDKDPDSTINLLSHAVGLSLKHCVKAGELPNLEYPHPKVINIKPQQRKKVAEDVRFTTSVALNVAGIIRSKSVNAQDEHAIDTRKHDADAVALCLAQHLRLPPFIEGLEISRGYLNFRVGKESELIEAATSSSGIASSSKGASSRPKNALSSRLNKQRTVATRRRFEMVMLPSSHASLCEVEFDLFRRYQIEHHGDDPLTVTPGSFRRFLCDSPFVSSETSESSSSSQPPCGFGSFHQQYWVDGQLLAVGVVDVLPRSLSSKYLFWDPKYASLSLGRLASLKEIEWIKDMQRNCPSMKYYLLGYYIHDCPRMRYKAEFGPSDLLDPLTHCWVPYDRALPALERAGSTRPPNLSEVPGALEGLGSEYRVSEAGLPLSKPGLPTEEDLFQVRILIPSTEVERDNDRRGGQITTLGRIMMLGILPTELETHLRKRIANWMLSVGPAWHDMIYRLG